MTLIGHRWIVPCVSTPSVSQRPLRVLIIGGGIGGLCLAHGLHRAGLDVRVFERTHARTDWLQGYRIHINPHGSKALNDCLSPRAWARFCSAASDEAAGLAFVTEQLRRLTEVGEELANDGGSDPAHQHHGISRIALREALLTDLDEVVELGITFQRYEQLPDGRVTAHFDDGTHVTGDLLVGADGANSRVRHQLLPQAERIDIGVTAIAGKYRLTPQTRAALPLQLTTWVNNILPTRRGSMFTAVWHADRGPHTENGQNPGVVQQPGLLYDTATDYTFWAYADTAARLPGIAALQAASGTELQQLVLDKITRWHPGLRHLVAHSDPDTVNPIRMRTAAPVEPWPTGPVTLLGDAIHNMTPMGGIGANTALRDADLIRRSLTAVRDGATLIPAVHDYEQQMLEYGFAAVNLSLRNARGATSSNPLARAAFRRILRITDRIPAAKRRMFTEPGH